MPILHFVLQPSYLCMFGAAFHRLQYLGEEKQKNDYGYLNCLKYICIAISIARSTLFLLLLKSSVILWLDELVYDDGLFRAIPILYGAEKFVCPFLPTFVQLLRDIVVNVKEKTRIWDRS
uniref:Uncharacterized protein n=1 Tax=Ditylenchus dipsaci TaxID=166011 RepID=A0A915DFU7_9BILA